MPYTLGIDLGESQVAAAIADVDTRETVDAICILHAAEIKGAADESEQNAERILAAVDTVVAGLHHEYRSRVIAIGVTGQMHGLILWNPGTWEHSPLITLADQRATRDGYLDELRDVIATRSLRVGYPGANLGWMSRYEPELLKTYTCGGTMMDYLVARICDLEEAVIDPSNAKSWGFFDVRTRSWKEEQVKRSGIPERFFPTVKPSGSSIGKISPELAKRWKLPEGLRVGVACGNTPAAIYASMRDPATDVSIALAEKSQMAILLNSHQDMVENHEDVEYRPFLDERVIAVTTCACGTRTIDRFVETLHGWLGELGVEEIPHDDLMAAVNKLGTKYLVKPPPVYSPRSAHEGASLTNIRVENLSLAHISRSIADGIISTLLSQMPEEHLRDHEQVVLTGTGARRSELLQKSIREITGLPVIIPNILEEAATGAALLVGDQLNS